MTWLTDVRQLGQSIVDAAREAEYWHAQHQDMLNTVKRIASIVDELPGQPEDRPTVDLTDLYRRIKDLRSAANGHRCREGASEYDGWTAYTPTWTSDELFPFIGNGDLIGKYRLDPDDGLHLHVRIRPGTSIDSRLGTGTYTINLPIGPADLAQWLASRPKET